jgi:hypothetical protein
MRVQKENEGMYSIGPRYEITGFLHSLQIRNHSKMQSSE